MSVKLVQIKNDGIGHIVATWINNGKIYPYSSKRQNTREKRKRIKLGILSGELYEPR